MTKQPFLDLKPTKVATVRVTGEQYHKPALQNTPPGRQYVELVLEPDNPYDSFAISVRYNNFVIGYIPRERTERYWPLLARITASGFTPRAIANIYKNPTNTFFDVSLFLSNNETHLPSSPKIPKDVDLENIPMAYSPNDYPPASAFTEEDRRKEKERRAKMEAIKDAQHENCAKGQLSEMLSILNRPKNPPSPDDTAKAALQAEAQREHRVNIGCGLAFVFVATMLLLMIIL